MCSDPCYDGNLGKQQHEEVVEMTKKPIEKKKNRIHTTLQILITFIIHFPTFEVALFHHFYLVSLSMIEEDRGIYRHKEKYHSQNHIERIADNEMVDKRSPHTPTPNCQTLTTHVSLKCHKPFIVFIAAPLCFIFIFIFILFLVKKKREKRKHGKTVG